MLDDKTTKDTSILVSNTKVFDLVEGSWRNVDLAIEGGKISALLMPSTSYYTQLRIDADGCAALPGLVDLSVHLREPGDPKKGTIASELKAATAAGVTTLCASPNTTPVTDTPYMIKWICEKAKKYCGAKVVCAGALTRGLKGDILSDMGALKEAGCRVLTNLHFPLSSLSVLSKGLHYGREFGMPFFLCPVEASLSTGGCVNESPIPVMLGFPPIAYASELISLDSILVLAGQSGARVHICRVSCADSVEKIAKAQAEGLKITADVAAHHLLLCDEDIYSMDPNLHVIPPLRSRHDREALRHGLLEGVIGMVCSDHQPHEFEAKNKPFPLSASGISSVETLLPIMLECVASGVLGLREALRSISVHPADILGEHPAQAGLVHGAAANLCLVDLDEQWVLQQENMLSAGKNTPFLGHRFCGKVHMTICEGNIAHNSGRCRITPSNTSAQ